MYEEGQARKKAEKTLCVFLLDISLYLGCALPGVIAVLEF